MHAQLDLWEPWGLLPWRNKDFGSGEGGENYI